jgi:hypothetical protein
MLANITINAMCLQLTNALAYYANKALCDMPNVYLVKFEDRVRIYIFQQKRSTVFLQISLKAVSQHYRLQDTQHYEI